VPVAVFTAAVRLAGVTLAWAAARSVTVVRAAVVGASMTGPALRTVTVGVTGVAVGAAPRREITKRPSSASSR
jgi:hypothetical protein